MRVSVKNAASRLCPGYQEELRNLGPYDRCITSIIGVLGDVPITPRDKPLPDPRLGRVSTALCPDHAAVDAGSAGEFCAGQPVQAHTSFSGLHGKVAVDLWWNAHHELAAEPPAHQWFGDGFLVRLQVLRHFGHGPPHALQRSLGS